MPDKRTAKTYCRFCLAFCGLNVELVDSGRIVRIVGDADHPISAGYSCKKGRSLASYLAAEDRLSVPKLNGKQVSWDDALSSLAKHIAKNVSAHGADSIGLYPGTAAILDAAGYWVAWGFLNKIGSTNLYDAATVDAVAKPFVIEKITGGVYSGLVPHIDFDNTSCLILIGTNPCVSHGHLAGIPAPQKKLQELVRRGGSLIVADPTRTQTAKLATLHVRPKPGTDYAWLAFILRELLSEGAFDQEYAAKHTSGLEELKAAVRPFDLALVKRVTNVDEAALIELLQVVKSAQRVSAATGTGVTFTPAAVATEWLTWALMALKGSLDVKGGVWFNPGLTLKLNEITDWKPNAVSEGVVASRPDLRSRNGRVPCAALCDEIEAGNLKVLLVAGGNPITAFPNAARTAAALTKLEALAVFDTHDTSISRAASHVLPVAGQLERSDSSANIQTAHPRMALSYTDPVVSPPGEARPMWWVFGKLGEYLNVDATGLGVPVAELADIDILRAMRGAKEFLSDGRLRRTGYFGVDERPFGWVLSNLLPNQRWHLAPQSCIDDLQRCLSQQSAGFVLVSMRQREHLNSQLVEHGCSDGSKGEFAIFLNPEDARALGLAEGDGVSVDGPGGGLVGSCKLSEDVLPGTLAVPQGFFGKTNVSLLTTESAVSPLTGMVTQSGLPVRVKKAALTGRT